MIYSNITNNKQKHIIVIICIFILFLLLICYLLIVFFRIFAAQENRTQWHEKNLPNQKNRSVCDSRNSPTAIKVSISTSIGMVSEHTNFSNSTSYLRTHHSPRCRTSRLCKPLTPSKHSELLTSPTARLAYVQQAKHAFSLLIG